jgi:hypothetical protein
MGEEHVVEGVPCRVSDRTGDVEHRRRIRIAAVEDVRARLGRDEADELADVLYRGRVEVAGSAVREHDIRAAVERPLDEEPFAGHPVAAAVDRARAHDGRGNSPVVQQDPFQLRLLRRIGLVPRLDGRLRLGNGNGKVREVVDALRFVERAPLPVGVDRGTRDGEERASIEREQLLRVRRFERDDVDDEIEAVRDGKRLIVVAVKLDEVELVERRRSISCAKRDLPLVVAQRMRDRCTDAAGSTDDERAPCDRV